MRPIRALAAALAVAVLPLPAAGETAAPLTLDEAVARALASYPAVAAARARFEAAGHRLAETESSRLPRLRATGSAYQYQEPIPATPIHGFGPFQFPEFDETLFQGALIVEYTVTDGGGRSARIRGGEAEAAAAEHTLDAAAQAVAARTAAVFLRAIGLEETLAAHDRRLEALDAERERTVLRLSAGRAAEVEVQRLDAALAAAAADRVTVETELATARADLGRLTGEPGVAAGRGLVPVALVSPEPPPAAELLARARAASPEIARAAERLRAAEAAVGQAEAIRRPRLSAVGNLLGFAGADVSYSDEWNAGLQLAIPLWAAGADRERIAAAESERQAAAESLRLAELDAAEALDRAAAAARQAQARAGSLERAVAANAEVVRIEALRLDAGVGVTADYLAAEADLLAARARLTEARQGEIAARVELARLTGDLGPEWIASELTDAPEEPDDEGGPNPLKSEGGPTAAPAPPEDAGEPGAAESDADRATEPAAPATAGEPVTPEEALP